MKSSLYRLFVIFIKPRSQDIEVQRQEYVLNVLLSALVVLAGLATLLSGIYFFSPTVDQSNGSFLFTAIFFIVIGVLLLLSRLGHSTVSGMGFICLLGVAALQLTFAWSFDLQQALLTYVMVIIAASIVLRARLALILGVCISIILLVVGRLQTNGSLQPDISWKKSGLDFGDALGYAITLLIIAFVSWLSNREIDRSLSRARNSEAALLKERDNLEIKVAERTRELEETQLVRLTELRRFAEFGRLSANLLHEVANPLTAASLNLEQLSEAEHSNYVHQAQRSLQQLERYVDAARRRLRGQSALATFSIRQEVEQTMRVVEPYARETGVRVEVAIEGQPKLYGDAVKFSQIIANLLVNAIEAYQGIKRPASEPHIALTISGNRKSITCRVQDWGKGIPKDAISRIFEPFYTTKVETNKSMGIGLSMVKQFVEEDFDGTITAESDGHSTSFECILKSQARS
ncbi:MAG: two-component sensor histidine kinase [Candidatus Saccharibacteria bacterium]|nr:two-component sensor histidine kinase [Candidatus Saccharibacteria bacterium]